MKRFTFFFFLLLPLLTFSQKYVLFAGTYTTRGSSGIYSFEFDAASGTATVIDSAQTTNPSFLATSASGRYLYCVNETGKLEGGGKVSAFRNNGGRLELINQVTSVGEHPCYIAIQGQAVVVGNYSSGNLAIIGTDPGGALSGASATQQHTGNGPDKSRQEAPHVHATVISPDGKYVVVTDLGLDQVSTYKFHTRKLTIEPTGNIVHSTPGSGPRHAGFHPNGKWIYVSQEMAGTVSVLAYKKGMLTPLQLISLLPDSIQKGSAADIHVSPDGRYLYVSNRQPTNTITIFSIDNKSGLLTRRTIVPSGGRVPRNFTIDPTGKWLLVANQETDNIRVFSVDLQSGMLTDTGRDIRVSMPVCLVWSSL